MAEWAANRLAAVSERLAKLANLANLANLSLTQLITAVLRTRL